MEFLKKNRADILKEKNCILKDGTEVPLLYFPLLENTKTVKHCFTTRFGGVSSGIFSSLNLSFTRGDEKEAVEENYLRLAEALEIEREQFVFSDQTHTTNVRKVTKADAGNGLVTEKKFFDTDGLITNEPGLMLSTFYADCVPLYFVDPVNRAIGLSHSGWRGTVGKIGKVTIEAMQQEYGSRPEQLICAIGPSICQSCYEVDKDVVNEFAKTFPRKEQELFYRKQNGKYQLNLWRANEIVFEEAGIKKENIATTNICTCCNSNLLFSHRASQGKRGNLGAFMMLEE